MCASIRPPGIETVRDFLNARQVFAAEGLALDEESLGAEWLEGFRGALRRSLLAEQAARSGNSLLSLGPYTAYATYTMRPVSDGGLALCPLGDGTRGAIAALLALVYEAMRDGTWPRLKICRGPNCGLAFCDRSKNGSAAWCSMALCGNRAKAQRRRARRKNQLECP